MIQEKVRHAYQFALLLIAGSWWAILPAAAEVITLRSGQTVCGKVLLHNEEVLVVQKADGTRYQYPAEEIASVTEETAETAAPTAAKPQVESRKKVAVIATVAGGSAYIPEKGWGGYTAVNLLVGSHGIGANRGLIGGGVGYTGIFVGKEEYMFIPLQLAAYIPLTTQRHAPAVAATFGYGFAVHGALQGGLHAGVNIGWHYTINRQSALLLGADVAWQGARVRVTETVNGSDYSNTIGCNLLTIGVKAAIQF